MEEATTAIEDTPQQQQQLAELQAKVENLRADPTKEDIVPIDLEKTPEFEAWKSAKIQECLNYLRGNWGMDITTEQLVMKEMYTFVDPGNPRAHASVHSGCNYLDPVTGAIAINPATGQKMSYAIWRKIDPPAETPVEVAEPTDTVG